MAAYLWANMAGPANIASLWRDDRSGGSRSNRGNRFSSAAQGLCSVWVAGEPVSAFVTFLCLVRPAILKMMGAINLDSLKVPANCLSILATEVIARITFAED